MLTKILLGLIVTLVALWFLADWYYHWIRRVQPVDNSDPFARPDLDFYVSQGSGSAPERSEALLRFLNTPHPDLEISDPFFESTLKILKDRRFRSGDYTLEQVAKSPYPTPDCLTNSQLEYVAEQKFAEVTPRDADHALHCRFCRMQVLFFRRRGSR